MKDKESEDRVLGLMVKQKPRTPEHIKRVLGLIEDTWVRTPDLRLMQLIINVADIKGGISSIFYLEDEELEEKFLRMSKDDCTADK